MATTRQFDLLLLDLVLPKRDGLEILREVRRLRPTLPVIILTARGEEADRVRGLSDGADDYVVKPFSVKELLARVEAVLRRSAERPGDVRGSPFPAARSTWLGAKCGSPDGDRAELSEREAELLALSGGQLAAGPSLATNSWPTSGGSRPAASPPEPSTCTSPGCARNSATTPASRKSC